MKLFSNTLLLLLAILFQNNSYAQENFVSKYRNYLPEQIASLSDEARSSSVPIMYTMAANTALSEGADLYFAIQLNKLMYPGIDNMNEAIRSFQYDLGEEPTGELTVGQIHDLGYLAELQSVGEIHFPDTFVHGQFDNYAFVEGTVKILDDRIAYPINRVEISCEKNGMYCEYELLALVMPDQDSWAQIPYLNSFDMQLFRVTRWENGQIDAVPSDQSSSACRTTTLNLNFNTNEFYEITRNLGNSCETLLGEIPKLEKPRISQIIDGTEIISNEFEAFKKKAYDAWSSDVRSRIDAFNPTE